MSKTENAVATRPHDGGEKTMTYTPVGEALPVELSVKTVQRFLTTPTRTGKTPNQADVVRFMMLCQARGLNPWVGDAFLVGYDSKDGPVFNLITSHQALLKRAECCPEYKGRESGVIVHAKGDKEPTFRAGSFVMPNEILLGGWARIHRDGLTEPSYAALNLETRNSGFGRWKDDAAGMIVKCAEAEALRRAFPSQTSGLYTRDEMVIDTTAENVTSRPTSLAAIAANLPEDKPQSDLEPKADAAETQPAKESEPEPATKPETATPTETSPKSEAPAAEPEQQPATASPADEPWTVDQAINELMAICDGGTLQQIDDLSQQISGQKWSAADKKTLKDAFDNARQVLQEAASNE